jgi:hypothetical protein
MTTLRTITHDPRQWLAQNMNWLRWPMVLAVLLVVGVLANVVDGRNALFLLILLLAIPALLLGSYVLLRWMAIGFVLLAPVNMLVPISIGTGSETSINATVLLILAMTGLWLFDMINNQRRVWVHRSRPILPLLLMLVATFISFLAGQLPWFSVEGSSLSAQIGGLSIFVISACAFLLAAHHIRDIRWLEWTTWIFVAVGAVFVVAGLHAFIFRRIGVFFQNGSYSSQFWTWFIIITFSQGWLNRKLPVAIRGLLFALCAAALYIVLGKEFEWKSGWIPPLVGIATLFALYSWKFLGALGIAALVASPVAISRLIATDEYSFGTRVDAWVILGEIIKTSPILGLGPTNYYWYTPLFAIRGYNVKFNSHNQYVDLLAQIGIVGTFMVLWFFAEVAWLGWKLLKIVPEGFPKAYVYGALAGLVATVVAGMLGDWFLPFVYNVSMVGMRSSILCWVFLGALVAMEQMYLRGNASEQSAVSSQP